MIELQRCTHGFPVETAESRPGRRIWQDCPHGCQEALDVVEEIEEALSPRELPPFDLSSSTGGDLTIHAQSGSWSRGGDAGNLVIRGQGAKR